MEGKDGGGMPIIPNNGGAATIPPAAGSKIDNDCWAKDEMGRILSRLAAFSMSSRRTISRENALWLDEGDTRIPVPSAASSALSTRFHHLSSSTPLAPSQAVQI